MEVIIENLIARSIMSSWSRGPAAEPGGALVPVVPLG